MPIVGVTDRDPQLPRIGTLNKGAKKGTTEFFNSDLPGYFRFESQHPEVAEAFEAYYGDKPNEITFVMGGLTPDEAFDAWNEQFGQNNRLKHRCDGEHVVLEEQGHDLVRYYHLPREERPKCKWAGLDEDEKKKMKPPACTRRARLRIIPVEVKHGRPLPILPREGVVEVRTTSLFDILMISSAVERVHRAYGTLAGITWTIKRVQRDVPMPGQDGSRAMKKRWLLEITPTAEWARLQLEVSRERMMNALPPAVLRALETQEDEDDEPAALPPAPPVKFVHANDPPTEAPATNGPSREAPPAERPARQGPREQRGKVTAEDAREAFRSLVREAETLSRLFEQEIVVVDEPPENATAANIIAAGQTMQGRIVFALKDAMEQQGLVAPADPAPGSTGAQWREHRATLARQLAASADDMVQLDDLYGEGVGVVPVGSA